MKKMLFLLLFVMTLTVVFVSCSASIDPPKSSNPETPQKPPVVNKYNCKPLLPKFFEGSNDSEFYYIENDDINRTFRILVHDKAKYEDYKKNHAITYESTIICDLSGTFRNVDGQLAKNKSLGVCDIYDVKTSTPTDSGGYYYDRHSYYCFSVDKYYVRADNLDHSFTEETDETLKKYQKKFTGLMYPRWNKDDARSKIFTPKAMSKDAYPATLPDKYKMDNEGLLSVSTWNTTEQR